MEIRRARFGIFEVDLDAYELRRGGERLRLQRQPFQVLALLLERPGTIVTREALRRSLWPDGTFVDFEHSLNAAIKRLRSTLGDSADAPRFVETVHRRGYRFLATVEVLDNGRPVVVGGPLNSRQEAALSTSSSPRLKLAVLPFTNLSTDLNQEFFGVGLTEELIARLGRLHPKRLGVIARTSAQRFKDDGCSIDQIGRDLQVSYVVEGSVRTSDGRVRISVQLIDARDHTHLWSETYDRTLEDFLAVQTDVSERVAQSLALELLPTTAREDDAPASVEANLAYLKGRFHWARWGVSGTPVALSSARQAIGYYETAIEIAPSFAKAHAALARALTWIAEYSEQPPRETLERALGLAQHALAIDPTLVWAHLARAAVRMRLDWDWAGAETDYARAVELEPNCEASHREYADFLSAMGRHAEAVAESMRATELDPLCLVVNSTDACVRYAAGQVDEAAAACRHVLELDHEFALARRLLGVIYLDSERTDEAIRELRHAVEVEGREPVPLGWLGHALAVSGNHDEAKEILAELVEMATRRYVSPYRVALIHTGLGDRAAALDALEKACDDRAAGVLHVAVEPRLGLLRADPRYRALLQRMRLGHDQ